MTLASPPNFDSALSTTRQSPGRFVVDLSEDWTVGGKPNGGYLVAVLVRCAALELDAVGQDHPHCITAATSFLGAPDTGIADVEVTVLRAGRGASQVRVSLLQGENVLVEATLTFAHLREGSERLYDVVEPPMLASFDECPRLPVDSKSGFPVAIMGGTDVRLDPAVMDWTGSTARGAVGELRGWAQFADERPVDVTSLHFLIDAFPPATFPLSSIGWVPTVQLTCYVRSLPAPGVLSIRQRVQVIEGGFVDEVCDIWDSTGKLVAQGTQLAKVRF